MEQHDGLTISSDTLTINFFDFSLWVGDVCVASAFNADCAIKSVSKGDTIGVTIWNLVPHVFAVDVLINTTPINFVFGFGEKLSSLSSKGDGIDAQYPPVSIFWHCYE